MDANLRPEYILKPKLGPVSSRCIDRVRRRNPSFPKTMTTEKTISDLPVDLLREIVCKVPMRDMRSVRLTCKTWDDLSKSDMFTKMHMRNEAAREAGESRMVMIMDFNLHLISAVVADVDHPSTESKGKLNRLSLDQREEEVNIIKVYHCEGLLLCVLKDTFKLVVWNPYLGQIRWIEPPSYSYRRVDGIDRYRYAFGYDHEKKIHKVLRFMDDFRPKSLGGHLLCYEMYDLESDLWRTLDVGTPHWYICYYNTGVPLNGKTYWLAEDTNSDDDDGLIGFNFTSERFGPILPLPVLSEEEEDRVGIRLLSCLKGEKLSLLLQFGRPSELEIWVTDPNNVSWSKFFKVDIGPAGFSYSGFFIDEEKRVAVVFDRRPDTRHTLNIVGEAGFFRQMDVDPLIERVPSMTHEHAHVCSYVPSLVQVQIKKRVFKRKQGSKLEIRPCQQNKSRRLDHEEDGPSTKRKQGSFEICPCQQNKSGRLDHKEDGPSAKRKLNQVILDEEEEDDHSAKRTKRT